MQLPHTSLETPYWSPGFGPCLCEHCRALRADIPSSAVPKSLTPGEETSLEKIALLRAYAGGLRAAIVDAESVLTREWYRGGLDSQEYAALRILSRALEIPSPSPAGTPETTRSE